MSERRRNLFVLLLVLGLIAGSVAVIATRDTKLGLDLQGGVSLTYQGKPTKQQKTITPDALQRAVDIIRERVDSLGVAEPSISTSGQGPGRGRPPGRQGRQARGGTRRHHRPAVLLRLGEEPPRRRLQDGPGHAVHGRQRHLGDLRPVRGRQEGRQVPGVPGPGHDVGVRGALLRLLQGPQAGQRRASRGRTRTTCGRTSRAARSPPAPRRSRSPRASSSSARPPTTRASSPTSGTSCTTSRA